MAYSVQVLLAGDVDGGGLVNEERGSCPIGVVGGEGDHYTDCVSSLLHQHCTAPLGSIHLQPTHNGFVLTYTHSAKLHKTH